ncbi:MAG: iron-containing alcohol dehydrogenase [Armatimonadota bacterium]
MITPFSFIPPRETHFGAGCLAELPEIAARFGRRAALARGGESCEWSGLRARVLEMLSAAGIAVTELPPQTREPEPEDVDAAVAAAREVDMVIALGGGSVIDLGKAVAALAPQRESGSVRDYLEGVGKGYRLEADPLPTIAVPTTAGTGTEATKNSVISSQAEGFKKSLRDNRMVPAVALIDPELTLCLPPALTAHTGMDALTQLIEAYTTRNANPLTDALALRGIEAARSLRDAVADGQNIEARAGMSLAAYLSGVCLANAGLGATHGIAAALGSVSSVPHGLACALALPWTMAINLPVAGDRYARVAEALTGQHVDDGRAAIQYIWELSRETGIPRVADLPELRPVFADDQLSKLAALCHGNSLRGNPRALTDDDLGTVLRAMRDAADPLEPA